MLIRLSVLAALVAAPLPTRAEIESHGPLLLIGVDGMTFDILDPMWAEGRLPTLRRLVDSGTRAVLLSEKPMRSPALWTTIATGQPRRVHGIFDFVTGSRYWPRHQRGGAQKLVTSDMRRAPALWHLATGRRSLVVGWLNSWPAEPIRGVMVAPYVALGKRKQTSIKGKIYEGATRQTWPPDAFDDLDALVQSADEVSAETVARVVDEPPVGSSLFSGVPKLQRYLYTVRWSIASAVTNKRLIETELARSPDTDLVMSYFDGADTLAHRFWVMREDLPAIRARLQAHGMNPDLAPELKRRFSGAIEGYYELFDEWLNDMIAAAGPEATVILVSDHGWGSSGRVKAFHDSVPFDGEHRLEGILIAAGPHIRHGRVAPLTLYDIAPTVLYLLAVGVPENLPGRVALELIDESFAIQHPPLVVAEKKPAPRPDAARADSHFQDEELERLRSLGYVH
jgi:predicted AlkP superfamily phosphohydrolase/phosphomutase